MKTMSKSVLILSASPRKNSNSDLLAEEFARGAREKGHTVEKISLTGKTLQFCKGCLICQSKKDGRCVMRDDADAIVQKLAKADVLVFATPIYFYEMSGQMKTLLDRTNPLFPVDYAFRDIYLLATAADEDESAMDGAVKGLEGWISCFEKCHLAGVVRGVSCNEAGSVREHPEQLKTAHDMGNTLE